MPKNNAVLVCLFALLPLFAEAAPAKKATPLPPVMFHGKPFFPVGCYDCWNNLTGNVEIDQGFLEAGGNFGILGDLALKEHPQYRWHQPLMQRRAELLAKNPRARDLALMVGISGLMLMELKPGAKFHTPTSGAELQRRYDTLVEELKVLARNPNVIGYTVDEPENFYWRWYNANFSAEWQRSKEGGLVKEIQKQLGPFFDLVRKHHPNALLMPILAWYGTYREARALYDVVIANEYPTGGRDCKPFKGPLFRVVHDARCAVSAAREAGGGRSAIYMPPMYDVFSWDSRILTKEEERYVCFAPITQGVMGICGWRLNRCSADYRKNVIYPVMKEISSLSPFFLGEWHDEKVSSTRDESTHSYLQIFPERVRMVEGMEDDSLVAIKTPVPDVAHCLRKNGKGEYLLLAVNNTYDTVDVTFQIRLDNLPETAMERIAGKSVPIRNGGISDTLKPFDVKAYVFK